LRNGSATADSKLLVDAGTAYAAFHDEKVRGVKARLATNLDPIPIGRPATLNALKAAQQTISRHVLAQLVSLEVALYFATFGGPPGA